MKVFYGNDCLPYKDKARTVKYPIVGQSFLGASNTTEIRFYFNRLGNTNTSWVAVAKLPNGTIGSKVLVVGYDSDELEPYAKLELNSFYTQYKGEVYISLQGYKGNLDYDYDEDTGIYTIHGTPVIQATGSIKIGIIYAPNFVGSGETENVTFEQLLDLIGTKVGETSNDYIQVINDIESEDLSQYEDGHIFFALSNYTYYQKDSAEPLGYKVISSFDPEFDNYYTKSQIDAMIETYTYQQAEDILNGGNI